MWWWRVEYVGFYSMGIVSRGFYLRFSGKLWKCGIEEGVNMKTMSKWGRTYSFTILLWVKWGIGGLNRVLLVVLWGFRGWWVGDVRVVCLFCSRYRNWSTNWENMGKPVSSSFKYPHRPNTSKNLSKYLFTQVIKIAIFVSKNLFL